MSQDLPQGWTTAPLSKVCEKITDGTHHSPPNHSSGEFMYVTAKNIRPWGLDLNNITYVTREVHDEIYSRCPVEAEDVLYIKDGVTTGLAAVNHLDTPFSLLSSVALFKPKKDVLSPYYLKHFLNSPETFRKVTGQMTGTAIKRVVLSQLRTTEISFPPLQEQNRIVARIEELTARSNTAKQALQAIPPLLEKFRQSILAAAFRGDLTAAWRLENPDAEPARTLIDRVSADQNQRWNSSGQSGRMTRVAQPNLDEMPALPDRWCWCTLEQLVHPDANSLVDGPFGSNLKTSDYIDHGVRVVRLGNLGVGEFKDDNRSFVSHEKFSALLKHEVRPGDLLIAALAEPVGRCCEAPAHLGPAIVKADCIKFKPHSFVESQLIMHFLNSPLGRSLAESASHGVGRLRINLASIRSLPIPLPPKTEQVALLQIIDSFLAQTQSISLNVKCNFERLPSLDSAILAKAFRGELVALRG